MQYVRSISGSVSKTWNSINPATLSGAIDVIVVEHDDGSLACSPFHVRFGKFSLLRPYEKKVEFRVNDVKQEYSMKLGEGGEAFFVFETTEHVPAALQTSPLVSPVTSPTARPSSSSSDLPVQEPEPLELDPNSSSSEYTKAKGHIGTSPMLIPERRPSTTLEDSVPLSKSLTDDTDVPPLQPAWNPNRNTISSFPTRRNQEQDAPRSAPPTDLDGDSSPDMASIIPRSASPPRLPRNEAVTRAMNLSKKLWGSNIPSHVNEEGDLMLDMTGYKTSEEEGLRAELVARQILSEELEGNYDIGSLIGADDKGNLWIYGSEEAKEAAAKKSSLTGLSARGMQSSDALSDPGYHSDDNNSQRSTGVLNLQGQESDSAVGLVTPPDSPNANLDVEPIKNFAKTLRLSSEQLKALNLRPGSNSMSFSVNKATCQANIYLWRHDVPIVISDIDGTITKSDALGHLLNMVGRDWTHSGVAKLYSDIVANGYNILYLTSRSVGQADTTRTYIYGINQDGNKLPKGPVIMSPDRTMAALRREVYLRKPEVFKMSCLRDIMGLFNHRKSPFYAGFGNRLTDALSYRSVNIPSTRIFTINSNAEVSLDLLSLNSYRTAYTSMRETVDQFFPPVGMLIQEGGEEYTDFNYWRDKPLELDELSASESGDDDFLSDSESGTAEDDLMSEELNESMYMSRESLDGSISHLRQSIETDTRSSLDRVVTQDTSTSKEEDENGLSLENSRASLESLDLVADAAGPRRLRNQPQRNQRGSRSRSGVQRSKTPQ